MRRTEANNRTQRAREPESETKTKTYEYFVDFIFSSIASFQFISHYVLFMVALLMRIAGFIRPGITSKIHTYKSLHIAHMYTRAVHVRLYSSNERVLLLCWLRCVRVSAIELRPFIWANWAFHLVPMYVCLLDVALVDTQRHIRVGALNWMGLG